uniref:Trypsin-like peptidase domain-containing protein n=1 Tax=Caenorhabditis tropicalis TaxID=1561998 RepID=A0A1I7UQP3_9PELO
MQKVKVTDGNEVLSMYTDTDYGLSVETLKSGFPNALNLIVPDHESEKTIMSVRNGKLYNPAGWNPEIIYSAYYGSKVPISDVRGSDNLMKFEQYLFYTRVFVKSNGLIEEDVSLKYACVPFYTSMFPRRYFVISTRHGSHECLEIGDEIKIYNQAHESYDVKVVYSNDVSDFIVFESGTKLCERAPIPGPINRGSRYAMLGFAEMKQCKEEDEHISPCYATGVVMSSQPNTIGHICGSSGGVPGMSGGPLFDLSDNSLIGICCSTDDLDDRETSFGKFTSDMITYCKEVNIVRFMPLETAVHFLYSAINTKTKLKRRLPEE